MLDREKSGRISPEIFVYATNKNFLNIYDALRIDKIKVEIAGYDPNTKRQTGHASAWLDRADARLLTHLISNRLFAAVTGGKWEKFGGSQREGSTVESRTLVVEWDEGDGGRFARFPYRITISNGPGIKTDMGAVKPAGEPTARINMRLSESDMIKIMLSIGSYMTAYETAHHHRLVDGDGAEIFEVGFDPPGQLIVAPDHAALGNGGDEHEGDRLRCVRCAIAHTATCALMCGCGS